MADDTKDFPPLTKARETMTVIFTKDGQYYAACVGDTNDREADIMRAGAVVDADFDTGIEFDETLVVPVVANGHAIEVKAEP